MNKVIKFAVMSLVSTSTMLCTTQAKADDGDGSIERFECLRTREAQNHLNSRYIRLPASERRKGLGFGGGDFAIKLSNDGFGNNFPDHLSYVGASAVFVKQKRENKFVVYFKPVNLDIEHVRIITCVTKSNGREDYLLSTLPARDIAPVPGREGWFTASDDISRFPGFEGAIVDRISLMLATAGDDGYILIGNTQVIGKKDTLDPSTLIMDKVPCSSGVVCGAYD